MFKNTPRGEQGRRVKKREWWGEKERENGGGGRGRALRGRKEGKVRKIHAFYVEVHCIKNHCPPHPRLNTADTGKEKRPFLSKDWFGNSSL